jgi:hypothetical protein
MMHRLGIITVALALLGPSAATGQQDQDCEIYRAALTAIAPDSTTPVVVYDSTSLGTPTFAFHAWTSMGAPRDSTYRMSRETWDAVRANNEPRGPLPECLNTMRRLTRVWYDSIRTKFSDREKGWEIFSAAYPGANGFRMFGKPYWPVVGGDLALIYVASASHWLAGGGDVLYVKKVDGRWTVVGRPPLWRS